MDSRSAKPRATVPQQPGVTAPAGAREGFCGTLRAARERAALSIEEIARITRIPEHSLRRLEAGEFEDMPGDVFVRGFLRSYARCVGLDADDVVRRYAECGGLAPAPVASDLARVAAEQAAAVAEKDDAGADVVSRPNRPARARPAENLAHGPIPREPTPPPLEAGATARGTMPGAPPTRPAQPGMSSSGTATEAGRGNRPATEANRAATEAGRPAAEANRATEAGRAATEANRAATEAGRESRPGESGVRARGSKQRRRERQARRRAPTSVPHAASSPRAVQPRRAAADKRQPAASTSRLPAWAANALRAMRRGPVALAIGLVALVLAAILTMSILLRRPPASDPPPPSPAAQSP